MFYVTNDERVYKGNALQLIKDIYKNENIDIRIRLVAAKEIREFEQFEGQAAAAANSAAPPGAAAPACRWNWAG